jgi:hypothetical protein
MWCRSSGQVEASISLRFIVRNFNRAVTVFFVASGLSSCFHVTGQLGDTSLDSGDSRFDGY